MSLVQAAPLSSGTVKIKGKETLTINKKFGKYSSISMLLNKSKSSQSPAHLSRELQRIEPRIKTLENDATLLRNLVPFGLKEIIDETNNDLLSLQKTYLNKKQNNEMNDNSCIENSAEKNDSNINIDENFNEIRQRIFTRLDSSIESLLKMIKEEKENIDKQENENAKKSKPMNKNLIGIEEDYLDEVLQRIESTTELINEKHSRIKGRINLIQKTTQKLYNEYSIKSKNDDESSSQKLKAIEDDCKIHKGEITDIKAKIDQIKQKLSHDIKEKMAQKILHQEETLNNTIEQSAYSNLNNISSDLSDQLQELKQEADSIKCEFQNSLIELKKETDEYENESQELTKKIALISSSTEKIEANSNDANKLVHELQDKINNLSLKIEQKEYRDSLITIVDQLKSTNEKIAEDINEIKIKITFPDTQKGDEEANEK